MRVDPDQGTVYHQVEHLMGFHTRKGKPKVHLVGAAPGRALCGTLAETVIPPHELPACPEDGYCARCVAKVWGWAPTVRRWHLDQIEKGHQCQAVN